MRRLTFCGTVGLAMALLLSGCGKRGQSPDQQSALPPSAAAPAPAPAEPAAVPDTPAAYAQQASAATPESRASAVRSASMVVPQGTVLRVRLDSALDTRRNRAGDRFTATLAEPIVIDGRTVIPNGSACSGRVVAAAPSGRLKGRAGITITLDTVQFDGRSHHIQTSRAGRASAGHKKRNLGLIAGGAGLGAALGAIAGGGRGALIGAGAGGGAGTAGAAATGKQNAGFPAEAMVAFTLRAPLAP